MSQERTFSEEVINEIGTQTLARFGLNIFNLKDETGRPLTLSLNLNTYSAYGESVKATNIVSETYYRQNKSKKDNETEDQKKRREASSRGYVFEDLDVGQKNVISELFNKGETTFTTDEIADIKTVYGIKQNGKKYENLNSNAKRKFDRVTANYSKKEIESVVNNKNLNFSYNDASTDTVTIDKDGNIIQKSQHKVIKDTDGFFEKELAYDKTGKKLKDENNKQIYKKDENGNFIYKYIENNDVFTMPFDDYKRHKENLEKKISNPHLGKEERAAAEDALKMLNKNNVTNRLMCDNPKTTAVITQSLAASGHIVQAGLSDAIVVSLSTLANGVIWEIKDTFNEKGSDTPIEERIKRLLKKVLEEFNKTFKRGASFGAIDVGIGILTQVFKSISSKLKLLWKELRTSLKSIYNAIYSYITGEIKSYKELFSIIIKSLLSAVMVISTVLLETELEAFLSPIITPAVASFLAPALSIVVASFAVVFMSRNVDLALNTLFGVFAQRDVSKIKAEKIRELCEELLPTLIEEREELKNLIEKTYKERKLTFEKSFNEFKKGLSLNDIDEVICGLISINDMYGKKLRFETQKEFDDFMESNCTFKL